MTTPTRRSTDDPNSALMQAHALLRMVIDENPNIILMKDWNGKFLLGNRALGSTVWHHAGRSGREGRRRLQPQCGASCEFYLQ
jgi:hypothetical protein